MTDAVALARTMQASADSLAARQAEGLWAIYFSSALAAAVILVALGAALVIYQRRFVALHRSYSKNLLNAQEEERAWVAREVHDDALQRVAMLSHELQDLAEEQPESVDRQQQRVQAILSEVEDLGVMLRRVAHRLHPALIDQAGLLPALNGLAEDVSRASGVQVEVDIPSNGAVRPVPHDTALILYRIAQEALRNVTRHSGVKRAALRVRFHTGQVELEVTDKGRGFASADNNTRSRGLGLVSMAERARLAGGRLDLWSRPNEGTTVRALVPIPKG